MTNKDKDKAKEQASQQSSSPSHSHTSQNLRTQALKDIKAKLIAIDTFESAELLSSLTSFEAARGDTNQTTDRLIALFKSIIRLVETNMEEVKQLKDALEKTKNMFVPAAKIVEKIPEPAKETETKGKYGFIKTQVD